MRRHIPIGTLTTSSSTSFAVYFGENATAPVPPHRGRNVNVPGPKYNISPIFFFVVPNFLRRRGFQNGILSASFCEGWSLVSIKESWTARLKLPHVS